MAEERRRFAYTIKPRNLYTFLIRTDNEKGPSLDPFSMVYELVI